MDITIRAVDDPASCRIVEQLQQQVWGFQPDEVVPYHQLLTAARWGGMVLLAFDGDQPIGFAYGFPGLAGGRPVLCSHMLGVLPAYRSRQVGYRLKLAQRDLARRNGFDRMVWTFDPLESRNAYLNLHKLGAFADTYYVNHYGEMQDDLNRGLPSDRLLADWRFGAEDEPGAKLRAETARADIENAPVLNPAGLSQGLPQPSGLDTSALGSAPVVRVAIPGDAGWLRRNAPDLARRWRFSVREALTTAFAQGYRAVDLQPPRSLGEGGPDAAAPGHAAAVAHYVLIRHEGKGD